MSSSDEIEYEEQVSMTINDNDETLDSDSDCGDSNSAVSDGFSVFTANQMIRLDEECLEADVIKRTIVSGMGAAGPEINIVAVHKNECANLTQKARYASFRIFLQAMEKKCGGNPNIRHCWYGGSKEELCDILSHGFSRCREAAPAPNGQSFGGVGVHMVPARHSYDGVLSTVADESGLRHMLLCRVIVGKPEVVAPGSKQSHPSSQEVDTGVDNLVNPRRVIVWSAFMNSHIFPSYVVSFKIPPLNVVAGIQARYASGPWQASNPRSTWITFPSLVSTLSKVLPPHKMALIDKCYHEFKGGKITRLGMVRKIREIGGEKLMIAVIKDFRSNGPLSTQARRVLVSALSAQARRVPVSALSAQARTLPRSALSALSAQARRKMPLSAKAYVRKL